MATNIELFRENPNEKSSVAGSSGTAVRQSVQPFKSYTYKTLDWVGNALVANGHDNIDSKAWAVARRALVLLGWSLTWVPIMLGTGAADLGRLVGYKLLTGRFRNDGTAPNTEKVSRAVSFLLPTNDFYKATARNIVNAFIKAGTSKDRGTVNKDQADRVLKASVKSEVDILKNQLRNSTEDEIKVALNNIENELTPEVVAKNREDYYPLGSAGYNVSTVERAMSMILEELAQGEDAIGDGARGKIAERIAQSVVDRPNETQLTQRLIDDVASQTNLNGKQKTDLGRRVDQEIAVAENGVKNLQRKTKHVRFLDGVSEDEEDFGVLGQGTSADRTSSNRSGTPVVAYSPSNNSSDPSAVRGSSASHGRGKFENLFSRKKQTETERQARAAEKAEANSRAEAEATRKKQLDEYKKAFDRADRILQNIIKEQESYMKKSYQAEQVLDARLLAASAVARDLQEIRKSPNSGKQLADIILASAKNNNRMTGVSNRLQEDIMTMQQTETLDTLKKEMINIQNRILNFKSDFDQVKLPTDEQITAIGDDNELTEKVKNYYSNFIVFKSNKSSMDEWSTTLINNENGLQNLISSARSFKPVDVQKDQNVAVPKIEEDSDFDETISKSAFTVIQRELAKDARKLKADEATVVTKEFNADAFLQSVTLEQSTLESLD